MAVDYSTVTEATGYRVTRDQLSRLHHRYCFAAQYCHEKDVLEVACGSGQGLGYLARKARRVVGGDYTAALVEAARRHYGGRVPVQRLDAHRLPFEPASFDVVILYEALYYLERPELFLQECRRVLRDRGVLLLCTVNREWSDFNPSPYSARYFSARELRDLLGEHAFEAEFFKAFPVSPDGMRDRVVSSVKRAAVRLGLMPKTMRGKEFLKRLVFGRLEPLPPEVTDEMGPYSPPVPLTLDEYDPQFKVLYAVARKR